MQACEDALKIIICDRIGCKMGQAKCRMAIHQRVATMAKGLHWWPEEY